MKGVLYVADHVDAWHRVLCRSSRLYLGVRPAVKGLLHERVDHHRHHSVFWLSGLCYDPAGAVLSAALEKLHYA
jgi:hypothetical protein